MKLTKILAGILLGSLLGTVQITKPEAPIKDIAKIALIPTLLGSSIGLKHALDNKAQALKKEGFVTKSRIYKSLGVLGVGAGLITLIALKSDISESLRETYFWLLRQTL